MSAGRTGSGNMLLPLNPAGVLHVRLAAALDSPELAPTEKDVVKILGMRRGRASAVPSREIAHLLGVSWSEHTRRWICETVETLVLLHRLPIGASRVRPYGYFLIETAADLDVAIHARWKEIYAQMRYLRALTSKQDVERLWGQAQLQLDSEDSSEKGYGHGI
jgi:hypothetical protein